MIVKDKGILLDYLKVISVNLCKTIRFSFGRHFTRKVEKTRLDEFFQKLAKRISLWSAFDLRYMQANESSKLPLQFGAQNQYNKSKRRLESLMDMRTKIINSMGFLELPYDLKCELDSAISDVEAQEFVDMEEVFYRNRRQFFIMGSCLFYKVY
jgi:hypothetical protein